MKANTANQTPTKSKLPSGLTDENRAELAELLTLALGKSDWQFSFFDFMRMGVHRFGGMTKLSRRSGFGRESLYKSLGEDSDPRMSTIQRVLQSMGLRLAVVPQTEKETRELKKRWKFFREPLPDL